MRCRLLGADARTTATEAIAFGLVSVAALLLFNAPAVIVLAAVVLRANWRGSSHVLGVIRAWLMVAALLEAAFLCFFTLAVSGEPPIAPVAFLCGVAVHWCTVSWRPYLRLEADVLCVYGLGQECIGRQGIRRVSVASSQRGNRAAVRLDLADGGWVLLAPLPARSRRHVEEQLSRIRHWSGGGNGDPLGHAPA